MVRNEFAEIISAIFAIFVFFLIGGVLIQSLGEQAQIFGNLAGLIGIAFGIALIAIIVKFIKSFFEDFF